MITTTAVPELRSARRGIISIFSESCRRQLDLIGIIIAITYCRQHALPHCAGLYNPLLRGNARQRLPTSPPATVPVLLCLVLACHRLPHTRHKGYRWWKVCTRGHWPQAEGSEGRCAKYTRLCRYNGAACSPPEEKNAFGCVLSAQHQ